MVQTEKGNLPHLAHLLYPDGRMRLVLPANGTDFSHAELKEMVGGLTLIVDIPDEHHVMVIRKTSTRDDLPHNAQATQMVALSSGDDIAGPALVCLASQVRSPDTHGLTVAHL